MSCNYVLNLRLSLRFSLSFGASPPQGNFHPALCQMSLMNFDFKPKFLHTQLAYLPYRCYLCGKIPISLYCCCCLFRLFRLFSKIYLPCCRKTLIWLWSGWIGTFLILHTLFQWEVSCCCRSPMWWVQMAKRKNSLSPHQMLEVSSAGFNDIITRLRVQFLAIMTQ